ncbi:zinc ribbon domain-containing protein [Candidatus Contubernalis alkaliaceticus]|uniref:zinc ribbon domain-containing protein n=1 Tax=Candidatus Contubernalis alkaliaceticus TaxID=338645 RepID=UPI001F4BF25B|nr:zinc ribbon domain-containing protein [Candidatus Contubernalis alkalaceticus]UNC91137.1 hypothetical protein HUE98_02960 [Candidatus Contubernalis alkalaceticus]
MADLQSVVGSGLNKVQEGLETGKKKIETAKEINQMKKDLQQLQAEKALQLTRIGQRIHYMYRRKEFKDEEVQEIAENMKAVDKKIWNLHKQIAEFEREVDSLACASCGANVSMEDKFCAGCGIPVEKPKLEVTVGNCSCCGTPVNESYKYCTACGQLLSE